MRRGRWAGACNFSWGQDWMRFEWRVWCSGWGDGEGYGCIGRQLVCFEQFGMVMS